MDQAVLEFLSGEEAEDITAVDIEFLDYKKQKRKTRLQGLSLKMKGRYLMQLILMQKDVQEVQYAAGMEMMYGSL